MFAMRPLTAGVSDHIRCMHARSCETAGVDASIAAADTRHVPTVPYRLRIPERCEFCNAQRTIALQPTTSGKVVSLKWVCGACHREWAVAQDRRSGQRDRRRSSRTDRRTNKR
jgi:hypothetical protein